MAVRQSTVFRDRFTGRSSDSGAGGSTQWRGTRGGGVRGKILPGSNAPQVFCGARDVSTRSAPPERAGGAVQRPCQFAHCGWGPTASGSARVGQQADPQQIYVGPPSVAPIWPACNWGRRSGDSVSPSILPWMGNLWIGKNPNSKGIESSSPALVRYKSKTVGGMVKGCALRRTGMRQSVFERLRALT